VDKKIAPRKDEGAILVMTAILAIALIAFAAVAVDLGNGFARKRMVQTQADLAALAGASALPASDEAIELATDYLVRNKVMGGTGPLTVAAMKDGNPTNGEIAVVDGNTRIEVTTPQANVSLGLARVLGQSNLDVAAFAAAEIKSPARVLPFFIPAGCAAPSGEIVLKAGAQSGGGTTPTTQDFFSPTSNSAQAASISSVSPLVIDPLNPLPLLIRGEAFADNATATTPVMQIGFVQGSIQETTADNVLASMVVLNTGAPTLDEITFAIPAAVLASPGKWFVQVRKISGNSNQQAWSTATNSDEAGYVFQVGSGSGAFDPADECGEKQTGDFGLLDSPRADAGGSQITQSQQRLDLNIARGIDHDVTRFPTIPPTNGGVPIPLTKDDNCRVSPANTPISGGVLDDWANIDNSPNCMNIFNGNKVDSATDGLITGGALDGGFKGKLDADTTVVGGVGCGPGGSSDRFEIIGRNINNDRLECFIDIGSVTALVEASDPNARLKNEIYDSPRFFVVPVLHYVVNPPNGYYPIVGWRGAFITGEYSGGESDGGIKATNSKLTEIKVIYFDLNRLPKQTSGTGQELQDYLGAGAKVVVLVE
jgi:hypothetical protein